MMRKRLFSIVVVFTILLSFIPTNIAFAATGQEVVDYAYNTWKGTPWKSWTEPYGPGIGVDCSYLVQNAYNHFGYSLPRSTFDQRYQGTGIDISGLKYSHNYDALKPGDLIFFNNYNHVGLYAGNGNFVHTSSSRGVVKQVLYGDGYNWHQYACEVRRIIDSPLPHTHSWTYGNDASHPHREYRTCSCGEKQYTGKTKLDSHCALCYPVGNATLTRSYSKTSKSVTFYRNNVVNANSFTVTLYRNGSSYRTVQMPQTELTVSGLDSGIYTATLTARNTNTNCSSSASCQSFTIVDTYSVTFDANGGTNAPSAQTKIKDEDLTLTSAKPSRAHYIFKGWAANKNETEPQYLAGGTYTKNTRITLYAVWEPETYTINFDTNGGKGEVTSTTITYGNTMKMPNTVIRDGYYLKGWSKTKGATTPDYKLGLDHMLDSNMTLYAVWGQSTWGSTVAKEFAGGNGTEENPYQISNAAELAHLADKVNNQQSEPEYEYYILTDNIDLNHEEWIPIGLKYNSKRFFKGSFDGNGFTISNLKISNINEGFVGLFGNSKESTIKNLTVSGDITDVDISYKGNRLGDFSAFIGGIIGYAGDNTIIENCTASYVNISNVEESSNYGCIIAVGCICGGFEGNIKDCTADECYIGLKQGTKLDVGIISGFADGDIVNCKVQSTEELFGAISDIDELVLGGVCGLSENGIIKQCLVKAGHLSGNLQSSSKFIIGGVSGDGSVELSSVEFTNGIEKFIDDKTYHTSIAASTDNGMAIVGGITGGGNVKNCTYNGQSISVQSNSFTIVGGANGIGANVNRCFINVDGIIYGNCTAWSSLVGGVTGDTGAVDTSKITNCIAIANRVSAVSNPSYYCTGARSSDCVGDVEAKEFSNENIYSYSGMELSSVVKNDMGKSESTFIGARRPLTQIKRESFLNTVFGPAYQSLAHLEEDPEAVWVIKNDEYPELYFTVLNDITVSDVEHGTISVDKTQAVDDEIVTVTAVPDEGYKLNKIYVNGEEKEGTTFEVSGNSDIYATFAEIPAEYKVSVAANANASAGLVNVDDTANTMSLQSVSLFSDNQALTATDGEEIKVNTHAAADYTVDAIYVNGEELAGDSFIVTDDSVVTMDAVSISTDVKATTYNAKNIRANGTTLSGKVDGDENSSKYIRYWRADTPSEIYTTEVETGSGKYSAEVTNLEPYVEYEYQMTEFGNVKSFTPEYVPIDDSGTEPVEPTEEPIKRDMCFEIQNQSKGKFSVSANVVNTTDETQSGLVIYAAYDGSGALVKVETETITDLAANGTFPVEFAIADGAEKYKILVWDSWKSMLPIATSVDIE